MNTLNPADNFAEPLVLRSAAASSISPASTYESIESSRPDASCSGRLTRRQAAGIAPEKVGWHVFEPWLPSVAAWSDI